MYGMSKKIYLNLREAEDKADIENLASEIGK